VVSRRPWKNYQRDFFKLEESHLKADRERARMRLETPEIKQQLEAARAELKAADEAISGNPEQRKEYEAALKAEETARSKEEEAKLYLGFDKSDQDAVYYKLREARHENHAAEEAKLQKGSTTGRGRSRRDEDLHCGDRRAQGGHRAAARLRAAARSGPGEDRRHREADPGDRQAAAGVQRPRQAAADGAVLDREPQELLGVGDGRPLPELPRGDQQGRVSEPWEVLQAKKANLPEAT